MKLNTTDFLRKCQHSLQMALGSVPVMILLVMNNAPELAGRMWLLPGAFVLLSWGCILLPGKRRLLGGIASAAAMVALGVMLLDVRTNLLLAALPVMYAALIFATLPIGGWERGHELNVAWHVTGICLYVLMQLLINGARLNASGLYNNVERLVLLCFLGYSVLVLLALNRASLESAAMSRRKVPVLMRRQNRVITMVLLALGVLIAAIPAIGSTLSRLWDLLMRGLAWLGALIAALMPQQQSSGGGDAGSPAGMFDLGEVKEPSALARFMEKLVMVAALVVLVILLIVAARALYKKLRRLMKYLWERLGQYSAAAGEDYEDEITDTRDEADVERASLFGRLRRMAPEDAKNMSPTEKVRYRYRRLRRKHPDWTQASTARETLPEDAAILYERARYSGETLTEEDAGRFRENTRRV